LKKRTLVVSTAGRDSAKSLNRPILCLGEWCRPPFDLSNSEIIDERVVQYHWNDRSKLQRDYVYLNNIYESFIRQLAEQLNNIHGVNFSTRYWRILVGPWLGFFLQILFDRWFMVNKAIHDSECSQILLSSSKSTDYLANNMTEFVYMITSDFWNEALYSQILDWSNVKCETYSANSEKLSQLNGCKSFKGSFLYRARKNISAFCQHLFNSLGTNDKYFIYQSYLPFKYNILLHIRLFLLPKFWTSPHIQVVDFQRLPFSVDLTPPHDDDFCRLACDLVNTHIPRSYFEGYRELRLLVSNQGWPSKPKAIYTSVGHAFDDCFKCYAAEKTEKGSALIISQHGGNYGNASWIFWEDHELQICDKYLSWGWTKHGYKNILPTGIHKTIGKSLVPSPYGNALLVLMTMPRQSYWLYSAPVSACQWEQYHEDQIRFVSRLSSSIRDRLLVRLYPHDYNLEQSKRWKARFPDVRQDAGYTSIDKLINSSRIFLATYNATSFLETFSVNFPTIVFWNPAHWELRSDSVKYFRSLIDAGIFHECPDSAARHLNAVWPNINQWWSSSSVQAARQEFCERYCKHDNVFAKIVDTLASS